MLISRPILCELAVDVMNVTNVGEWVVQRGKDGGQCPPYRTNEAI